MAARAIWKGLLKLGELDVPVKLYSAMVDRSVHFRLLHRKDKSPVQQVMVNPQTGEHVDYNNTLKAYSASADRTVLLSQSELASLQPPQSRDISLNEFLPRPLVDARWYDRPYYLGPDGNHERYAALANALDDSDMVGIAEWTMRNKQYTGALQTYRGYPMLISLRSAQRVISVADLEAPSGEPLAAKDLLMARQLIEMLSEDFDPMLFRDEYRERVLQMISNKQQGKKVQKLKQRPAAVSSDLNRALVASLQRARA